jgi:hypothetical protein
VKYAAQFTTVYLPDSWGEVLRTVEVWPLTPHFDTKADVVEWVRAGRDCFDPNIVMVEVVPVPEGRHPWLHGKFKSSGQSPELWGPTRNWVNDKSEEFGCNYGDSRGRI